MLRLPETACPFEPDVVSTTVGKRSHTSNTRKGLKSAIVPTDDGFFVPMAVRTVEKTKGRNNTP